MTSILTEALKFVATPALFAGVHQHSMVGRRAADVAAVGRRKCSGNYCCSLK